MHLEYLDSIFKLSPMDNKRLLHPDNPFLNFKFLSSLEKNNCCGTESGWQPHHFVFRNDQNEILGLMPSYIKSHSWGEYVFDWSWAQAYRQHGLNYYPKLVTAIPFTPVDGPRIFLAEGANENDLFIHWLSHMEQHAVLKNLSSWHLLFNRTTVPSLQRDTSVLRRIDCQFHWHNDNYVSFADMLDSFTSRKRKNITKERKSISNKNVRLQRYLGKDITRHSLINFFEFYTNTYEIRGHTPHLNFGFFEDILDLMPENIMLVTANHENIEIASALFFFDKTHLYGRYWGCKEDVSGLHFECCYYQGIEFCIEQGLKIFNPGTQGEHKISRGFKPIITESYHWIKHPEFSDAIKNFLLQEEQSVLSYAKQAECLLPFKKD